MFDDTELLFSSLAVKQAHVLMNSLTSRSMRLMQCSSVCSHVLLVTIQVSSVDVCVCECVCEIFTVYVK